MIEIVQAESLTGEGGAYWACWLQITQGPDS